MNRLERVENLLRKEGSPVHFLEVIDESNLHKQGSTQGTHLKIYMVSPVFSGLSLLKRQRWVHEVLKQEFDGVLHAISVKLLSPEEWEKDRQAFATPACSSVG